ncbi:MAG: hypothetical protein R6U32_07640 [Candidatus Woesearchaeota archaeon]
MKGDQMEDKPIFVKIDSYEDIRDVTNLIKQKLADAKATLDNIQQLRQEEEAELDAWGNELEDVEKKIAAIDNSLFE